MKNLLTPIILALVVVQSVILAAEAPQLLPTTPADLGMERHQIRFPDDRMWIFNGRIRMHCARWSATGFSGLFPGHAFNFDFIEKRSGIRILDNVNEIIRSNSDPLGYNFRPGAPFIVLAQDDTWYPHAQERTATFHREIKSGLVSFAVKTRSTVSARADKGYITVTLSNRDDKPLDLTLVPRQNGKDVFCLPITKDGKTLACVSSDLTQADAKGFLWSIPPHASETRHFSFTQRPAAKSEPTLAVAGLAAEVAQCEEDGKAQIARITSRVPAIRTKSRQLDDFYRRCIASLALCRWDRPEWRNHPTWVPGGFICVTAWDFSYAADALALIEPQAIRWCVRDVLGLGRMKSSYIGVTDKLFSPLLYIQDPFALKTLIERYITVTGDATILDDDAGGTSVYEWLKRWSDKVHGDFGNGPGGLIDVKEQEELLIEIRTSDYNHIVPVVNGLMADYDLWLAKIAAKRQDPDAPKFARLGENLSKALHEHLWNEKAGWFDNLRADGSRRQVYTNHLYDLLGTSLLTPKERAGMVAHIREGEFLGNYGMYSISKKDTVHWDRMDGDWGGGGSYLGSPLRIARQLYECGEPAAAWDTLKRMARLADHFCFLPQSPYADEPDEFRGGGNLQISCGSGMEAIWYGIFGLRPQEDGSMVVDPAPYNPEIGDAELSGYLFRGHRFDVRLGTDGYEAFLDGRTLGKKPYRTQTEAKLAKP